MVRVTSGYTTRSYQPDDQEAVLELLRLSLGESATLQRTSDFWQWKHLSSPFGPSYVRVACAETGQLVGMRAFMRWEFTVGGRLLRAVRAVDTATHPDYRRMGIFSNLTSEVVDEVQQDGVDLIFNTPNQDVVTGYLKLGWHYVARVRPLVKVLNYPRFALGLARGRLRKGSPGQHPPSAFFRREPAPVSALLERRPALEELIQRDEECWERHGGIRPRRSWDYLGWRYAKHPTIPYQAEWIEEGDRLQGCAIYRTNTRFGLKEVVLSELMLAEPRENLGRRLLGQLRSSLRADYLIGYFPQDSFHRQLLEGRGFRPVPRQGMNFTVRPLTSDIPQDPRLLNSWLLGMGDLELF